MGIPLQEPRFSTIGKVVALHDADSMIPFLRSDQLALHTGRDLKSLYTEDGNILLFAGTQHGQEIMFQSGIPLRNFIDYRKWKILEYLKHPALDVCRVYCFG